MKKIAITAVGAVLVLAGLGAGNASADTPTGCDTHVAAVEAAKGAALDAGLTVEQLTGEYKEQLELAGEESVQQGALVAYLDALSNLEDVGCAPSVAAPLVAKQKSSAEQVHYKNCDEVRAAGKAPILRGQPGYRPGLDRDGDGVGCEVAEPGAGGGNDSTDDSTGGSTGGGADDSADGSTGGSADDSADDSAAGDGDVLASTGVGGSALPWLVGGGALLLAAGGGLFVVARRRDAA